jgi:hypothetical protein
MDGQEVHYSNSRSNLFDYSWTMRGNHVLKIVAHASPPMTPTPGFRQYDFFINGQSFFTFPKVFRLGLTAGDSRGASSPTNPAQMAESSRRSGPPPAGRAGQRLSSVGSGNITTLEAPGNSDEVRALIFCDFPCCIPALLGCLSATFRGTTLKLYLKRNYCRKKRTCKRQSGSRCKTLQPTRLQLLLLRPTCSTSVVPNLFQALLLRHRR